MAKVPYGSGYWSGRGAVNTREYRLSHGCWTAARFVRRRNRGTIARRIVPMRSYYDRAQP